MADPFQAPAEGSAVLDLSPPASGSRYHDPAEATWQATDAPGFWLKPLLDDRQSGLSTALMKIDPGAYADWHAHQELEQILVLEGSFHDQDQEISAGGYVVRAPGASHTAGSREGAVVLLIFTAAQSTD